MKTKGYILITLYICAIASLALLISSCASKKNTLKEIGETTIKADSTKIRKSNDTLSEKHDIQLKDSVWATIKEQYKYDSVGQISRKITTVNFSRHSNTNGDVFINNSHVDTTTVKKSSVTTKKKPAYKLSKSSSNTRYKNILIIVLCSICSLVILTLIFKYFGKSILPSVANIKTLLKKVKSYFTKIGQL